MDFLTKVLRPLKRLVKAVARLSQPPMAMLNRDIPAKHVPMTQLLIGVNIALFIVQILVFNFTECFALNSSVWYTYITSCFLHGSVRHLLGNMLFLSFIFPPIEKKYGSIFILLAYIVTGIFGCALFALFLPNAHAIGASGSIFGMMMIWILHNIMEKRPLLILPALFYFMLEGMRSGVSLIAPDGIAHLGHYGAALGAFFLLPLMLAKRK